MEPLVGLLVWILFIGIGVEVVTGLEVGRSSTEQGALPNVCFFLSKSSMDTSFIAGRGFKKKQVKVTIQ